MTKQGLMKAFGEPFTTKKKVRDALGYATYEPVRPYFYGLAKVGNRYLTSDVVERILEEVEYGD